LDSRISEFILPSRCWDIPKLKQRLPHHIVDIVSNIPLHIDPFKDEWCWSLTRNGMFSTKSATWMCHDLDRTSTWEGKWIWKINLPPKIKIFLWQIYHNSLPIRGTLLRRGMHIDVTCLLCQGDIESFDHLYIQCPCPKNIWALAHSHQWITRTAFPTDMDGRRILSFLHSSLSTTMQASYLLWSI